MKLIQSKEFKQCISRIGPAHLQKDLASEVCLALLETKPEKIIEIDGKGELKFYAVRIILNMACSNTSPFYKKYRSCMSVYYDDKFRSTDEQDNEINIEALFKEEDNRDRKKLELLAFNLIDGLYWYDAEILKLYLEHGNYRKIAKEIRIPFASIHCTVRKAITELKERIANSEIPTDEQINEMINKIEKILQVV